MTPIIRAGVNGNLGHQEPTLFDAVFSVLSRHENWRVEICRKGDWPILRLHSSYDGHQLMLEKVIQLKTNEAALELHKVIGIFVMQLEHEMNAVEKTV